MLYKPQTIHGMWDSWIYHWEGNYYLYYLTMGLTERQGWHGQGVAMAWAKDGVHWEEQGVVIPKDEGAVGLGTGAIWRATELGQEPKFIVNYSSWFDWCIQSQNIRFAESVDLVHWRKLGAEFEFRADSRWYETYPESERARWDCIYAIPRPGGGLYGYWTALPKERPGFGFGETLDGVRWRALEPPMVEDAAQGEVGAVEKIGDTFYMLYQGGRLTLVAESPAGPFRPARKNRELLNGNAYFTRFVQSPDGLLVCHHSVPREGYSDPAKPGIPLVATYQWANSQGVPRFAPLKRALLDDEGTLRLAYWEGNESLKGRPVGVAWAKEKAVGRIRMLDIGFDVSKGLVLEGHLPLSAGHLASQEPAGEEGGNLRDKGAGGLFIEWDPGQGSYILLGRDGTAELGLMGADGSGLRKEWTIDRQLTLGPKGRFLLMLRDSFVEFYLEGLLIQVYSLPKRATGRIGMILADNTSSPEDLRAWEMSL